MRRKLLALAALLALGGCGRSQAEDAVAAILPDPRAARFQSVIRHGDAVCGEVNAVGTKGGGSGGVGGYTRFVYRDNAASIAPIDTYTPDEIAGFEATCRMLGGQSNGLDRQVCTRAADARKMIEKAAAFETLWQRSCEG